MFEMVNVLQVLAGTCPRWPSLLEQLTHQTAHQARPTK
jgi:hypothetical protein